MKEIIIDQRGRQHAIKTVEPRKLKSSQRKGLVRELTPVTARGFLTEPSPALAQDVANHVLDCDRLSVTRQRGRVSSFIAADIEDGDYHLGGIIVEPEHQRTGLGYEALRRELVKTDAETLRFHTQSKKVKGLGNKVARIKRKDGQPVVDKRRYGGKSLYGNVAEFESSAIQDINWREGDAEFCQGRVRQVSNKRPGRTKKLLEIFRK